MIDVVDSLDVEWQHLVTSPATARTLARWRELEPTLDGLADLEAIRSVAHDRGNPERGDQVLAALVRLAAVTGHGDQLATRAVLQLLIPGAIRLGNSLARMFGDQATSKGVVFAELTIGIRTYPWQRRPRRIAANLLLDCRQRLVRRHRRGPTEITVGLAPFETVGVRNPEEEFALHDLLRWARSRGVLSHFEVQLLVASHVADVPMNQLTTVFGRSRSTLSAVRTAAEQRLRQALEPDPAIKDPHQPPAPYEPKGLTQATQRIAMSRPILGAERQALAKNLVKRYKDGESIRALASSTGRSYGFVHNILTESRVQLRSRGTSRVAQNDDKNGKGEKNDG